MQHHTTDRISSAMTAALALIFSVPTSQAAATPGLRKRDVVAGDGSRAILLCIASALLLVVVAAPAGAAPRPDGSGFSCRASAVRALFPPFPIVGQPPTLEPLIANRPEAPCADDAAQTIGAQTVGPAMTETLRVATDVTPNDLSSAPAAEGDNATASSTVERATITGLPAAIAATGLTADATFTCTAGQPVGTSSGRVASLTVGGVTVTVPDVDNFVVPLIWGDSLTLNQVIVEPTKITRRAMFLDVNGNTGLPDIAISEASVGLTGNPCAAAAVAPPPGTPPAETPPAETPPAATPPAETPPAATPPAATAPPAATPPDARRPARARLTTIRARFIRYGVNRCISPPFIARVVGVNIAHVTFTLGGKAERRDNSAPFQMRINTHPLRPGIHRLTARVVFRRATRASPRTLRFSFRRCANVAA